VTAFPTSPDSLQLIQRGLTELISEAELRKKLAAGRPLRIKAGFDPTAPNLHLGHVVLFRKLAHFQKLGHTVIFLIGDFTGMIGDPSGRLSDRPDLTPEQVLQNARTYQEQIGRILDVKKLEVRFNSEWFGPMRLADFLGIARKLMVPRLLERDDFTERLKSGASLTVTEAMYPLLQGYDSVMLKADLELGGSDQKFNLLMGRLFQERFNQPPQVVATLPLLEGTDGVKKMSKSYGNAVGITEPPQEMFGKLMSIPDALTPKYFELLTDADLKEVKTLHPMEAKQRLAREIIAQFHGQGAADAAQKHFDTVFRKRDLPEEIPTYRVPAGLIEKRQASLAEILAGSGAAPSKGEARRLIQQGAVDLDGVVQKDPHGKIPVKNGSVLKVGKRRFLKLLI